MPIRYMGTKRHMASQVRDAVASLSPSGAVVDLFGGMGSVCEALAPDYVVYENDFLRFASAIAEARLTDSHQSPSPGTLIDGLSDRFESHRDRLLNHFGRRVQRERAAIGNGAAALAHWFETAPNAAISAHYQRSARLAARSRGPERFQLVTLYFSAGYYSTEQAIELDAIRAAIEGLPPDHKTSAVAAWLVTASRVVNSPGHTAQHLRPNSEEAYQRIRRVFRRSPWSVFESSIGLIAPVGTPRWRRQCRVFNREAHALLRALDPDEVGLVYADPPYTKDQYSRYYHVLETMARYDFPGANGRGRTPEADRPMSAFSRSAQVIPAFEEFFRLCSRLGVPVVLSYPANGLAEKKGPAIEELATPLYRLEGVSSIPHRHSTLGGSNGAAKTSAAERVFMFVPRSRVGRVRAGVGSSSNGG